MTPDRKIVWIAEDDDELRALLAELLRKRGFLVVEFADGARVIADFEAGNRPHLLLTDHHMPEIHGIEVIEWIRALGLELPAILVSAFAEADLYLRAASLRDVTLVEKPCDVRALVRLVGDRLGEV